MQAHDRQAILDALRALPLDEQLEIAQEILSGAQRKESERLLKALGELRSIDAWLNAKPAAAAGKVSVATLRGIARMENPPDDAAVERWIEEHRLQKYGA